MKHEKILSLIHCTVRAAALLALLIALAGAVAVYSAEPEVKVTFDKFEPGLLYYQAPHGNAYDIMGSEDLIHWRFLATTVMRGWTDRTPVWFRHTEPHRFFDFVKVQDFAFPDWDEFEDYELGLSVSPFRSFAARSESRSTHRTWSAARGARSRDPSRRVCGRTDPFTYRVSQLGPCRWEG